MPPSFLSRKLKNFSYASLLAHLAFYESLAESFQHLPGDISKRHSCLFDHLVPAIKGRRINIIASGASADKFAPKDGELNIGINYSILNTRFQFDYAFFQDYDPLLFLSCKAIPNSPKMIAGLHFAFAELEILPTDFPADYRYYIHSINSFFRNSFRNNLLYQPVCDFGSTIFAALQILLFCKPERISLVGCDCDKSVDKFKLVSVNDYSFLIPVWKAFAAFAKTAYPDVKIVSINPVGLKGLFRDVYVDLRPSSSFQHNPEPASASVNAIINTNCMAMGSSRENSRNLIGFSQNESLRSHNAYCSFKSGHTGTTGEAGDVSSEDGRAFLTETGTSVLESLRSVPDFGKSQCPPERAAHILVSRAKICLRERDYQKALNLLEEAIAILPNDRRAVMFYVRNAIARAEHFEFSKLTAYLDGELQNSPISLYLKARWQIRTRDYYGACKNLIQAIMLKPFESQWHATLIDLFVKAGLQSLVKRHLIFMLEHFPYWSAGACLYLKNIGAPDMNVFYMAAFFRAEIPDYLLFNKLLSKCKAYFNKITSKVSRDAKQAFIC